MLATEEATNQASHEQNSKQPSTKHASRLQECVKLKKLKTKQANYIMHGTSEQGSKRAENRKAMSNKGRKQASILSKGCNQNGK